MTSLTVIVPTFKESGNVGELVRRLGAAFEGEDARVLFVDDSPEGDATPDAVLFASRTSNLSVDLLHRSEPVGGLSGAVVAGILASDTEWCLVMDGDLQHPPELAPVLYAQGIADDADVVVASRYCGGGDAGGLANGFRQAVSTAGTLLARSMFPRRLRNCTDPMTGFFAFRRSAVAVGGLRPSGFKILLEILARQDLRVAEVPFVFGKRLTGESKASLQQGKYFAQQLLHLRFGRGSQFAAIGALGAVLNLGLMFVLTTAGVHYLVASVLAAEISILFNFLLQERWVFSDLRGGSWRRRFGLSVGYDNLETLVRLPVLVMLVGLLHGHSVTAQALTLAASFLVRFVFKARVVYGIGRSDVSRQVPEALPEAA